MPARSKDAAPGMGSLLDAYEKAREVTTKQLSKEVVDLWQSVTGKQMPKWTTAYHYLRRLRRGIHVPLHFLQVVKALRNWPTGKEITPLEQSTAALTMSPPLREKPSIAVLRFENLSDDPAQEYFVNGVVRDIITAISQIRWLDVISPDLSFSHENRLAEVWRASREFGVRYVLQGSVRKANNRVRISAHLIDAADGRHVWDTRFDGLLEDVFVLQDNVAQSVAGAIEPAVHAYEFVQANRRPRSSLSAPELWQIAHSEMLYRTENVPLSLSLAEEAISRDPRFGLAYALVAFGCYRLIQDGRTKDAEADRQKGIVMARRALELSPDDPRAVVDAAQALAHFGDPIDPLLVLVDRAVSHSSSPRAWEISGVLRLWAGELDTAIEHLTKSMHLSGHRRVGKAVAVLGYALFLARKFDAAVPKLQTAIEEDASHPNPYRYLAACLAHMGRVDAAREVISQLRSVTHIIVPNNVNYLRKMEHRELLLSGLRRAIGESPVERKAPTDSPTVIRRGRLTPVEG